MNLKDAAIHCEKAWSHFAHAHNIKRDEIFYVLKLQEELGELSRTVLELRGSERKTKATDEELKKKFEGDIASIVGNALILANYHQVDLEKVLRDKFPSPVQKLGN